VPCDALDHVAVEFQLPDTTEYRLAAFALDSPISRTVSSNVHFALWEIAPETTLVTLLRLPELSLDVSGLTFDGGPD
jgi:hypothetical protein